MVDLLGISKGFGYVSYYRLEDSERAIVDLDNKEVHGKNLKVTHLEHGRAVEKRRNNIYVKHIPKSNFNDEALMKLFQPYGEIKSAVVLLDGEGNSKGFGFVCFALAEDAEEAFKNMNEKSMFKDLPALYVNFAMKKSERLEHLQKKKEENYKNAQKMTIFAKIKDENAIKSEVDFVDQIKNYLKISFGKDYEPKTIKIRFETKNAFVTMNSQRDAEEFIRKFQEYTKENQTTLFFNLYKSKVERISANAYFKKYNQFSGDGEGMNMGRQQRGGYKKYNDFATQQGQGQQGGFPYNNMNGAKRYNNFDEANMNANPNMNMNQQFVNQQQGQQRGYVSYNNFPNTMQQGQQNMNQNMNMNMQMQQNKVQQPMMQQSKFDPQDEDAIGEYLYNFVEGLYPE
jgi:polyadenylate-binding protein